MIQDSVVAIVPESAIDDVLPAVHRAGLGHLARLVRAGRGSVLDQLRRAGIPTSQAPDLMATTESALLITAAARSQAAGALLLQQGAVLVWNVTSLGAWVELDDAVLTRPNVHILPPHPAQRIPGRDTHTHVMRAVPEPAGTEPVG